MKTTRIGIFETNSSSTHSISLSKFNIIDASFPLEDDKIILRGGEFGWGYEKITNALTKANYCAVAYQYDESRLEMLKEAFHKVLGEDIEVEINIDDYSYIDHQSFEVASDELCTQDDIINFIFNPDSVLIIDNDNH